MKVIGPEEIMHIVCHVKGVNQDFLFEGRKKVLVQSRQLIAFFMRRYCRVLDMRFRYVVRYKRITVRDIGLLLNQDHSSVLYSIKSIERDMRVYADLRKEVEMIDDVIRRFRIVND